MLNQLEKQVKQLKANNDALKLKAGGKGNGDSPKRPWNNSGKRPERPKGKKNFPPRAKNKTD